MDTDKFIDQLMVQQCWNIARAAAVLIGKTMFKNISFENLKSSKKWEIIKKHADLLATLMNSVNVHTYKDDQSEKEQAETKSDLETALKARLQTPPPPQDPNGLENPLLVIEEWDDAYNELLSLSDASVLSGKGLSEDGIARLANLLSQSYNMQNDKISADNEKLLRKLWVIIQKEFKDKMPAGQTTKGQDSGRYQQYVWRDTTETGWQGE